MTKKSLLRRYEVIALRLKGWSYTRIAVDLGISRQRVYQLISPLPQIRKALIEADGGQCQECGIDVTVKGAAHVHHLSLDCSSGEYNDLNNLQLLCISCHRKAHNGFSVIPMGRKSNSTFLKQQASLINEKALCLEQMLSGTDLRTRRLLLGLSQDKLARKLGVATTTVARWERGEGPIQHPLMVIAVLEQLEASLVATQS
jgi:DNA-binding transcriptional regulator YiaG